MLVIVTHDLDIRVKRDWLIIGQNQNQFSHELSVFIIQLVHYPDLKARPLKTHCVPMLTSKFSGNFCWGAVDARWNASKGIRNRRSLILDPRWNDNCEEDSCLASWKNLNHFDNHLDKEEKKCVIVYCIHYVHIC